MNRWRMRIKRMVVMGGLGILAVCATSGCDASAQADRGDAAPVRPVSAARTIPATLLDPDMKNLPELDDDYRAMRGPAGHRNEIRINEVRVPSADGVRIESIDEAPWGNGATLEAEIDPAVMAY